jgi:hypothetical protein
MSLTVMHPVQGVEKSQGIEFGTSSGIIESCGVFTLLGARKTYLFLAQFTPPHQILVQGRPYSQLTRPEKEHLTANLANRSFEVKSGNFIIS